MELFHLLSKYRLFGRLNVVKHITINLSQYLPPAEQVFTHVNDREISYCFM